MEHIQHIVGNMAKFGGAPREVCRVQQNAGPGLDTETTLLGVQQSELQ